jgi:hypothetical protein
MSGWCAVPVAALELLVLATSSCGGGAEGDIESSPLRLDSVGAGWTKVSTASGTLTPNAWTYRRPFPGLWPICRSGKGGDACFRADIHPSAVVAGLTP